MQEFSYVRPEGEAEALRLAAQPGSRVIAGGTELLNWMRLGIDTSGHLIDVGGLARRGDITVDLDGLHIGALATLNAVGESPEVREHARGLADACLAAASAQLRNRATLGGNVLQRTRCAYFRAEAPLPWSCNKREPGTGCAARRNIGDEHAIFGGTEECVATHPSDPLVALVCLDAEVELASAAGRRQIPVRDLHLTQREAKDAGEDPARCETTLQRGELILGYRIPLAPGSQSAYVKVRERQSYAYAIVSAAASVALDGETMAAVRIALGSVAQRPWRLRRAEAALVGQRPEERRLMAAIADDLGEAQQRPENAFKVTLARNSAMRAVLAAVS